MNLGQHGTALALRDHFSAQDFEMELAFCSVRDILGR
jgi:hypothetical protein